MLARSSLEAQFGAGNIPYGELQEEFRALTRPEITGWLARYTDELRSGWVERTPYRHVNGFIKYPMLTWSNGACLAAHLWDPSVLKAQENKPPVWLRAVELPKGIGLWQYATSRPHSHRTDIILHQFEGQHFFIDMEEAPEDTAAVPFERLTYTQTGRWGRLEPAGSTRLRPVRAVTRRPFDSVYAISAADIHVAAISILASSTTFVLCGPAECDSASIFYGPSEPHDGNTQYGTGIDRKDAAARLRRVLSRAGA